METVTNIYLRMYTQFDGFEWVGFSEMPMHTCFIAIKITHEILLHREGLWVRA